MSAAGDGPVTVVFDIGGVLIDWDPRYLYRQLFDDQSEMEHFLTHICSNTWNLLQDAGRSFKDGVAELAARYPEHSNNIAAYDARWNEMVSGPIAGTVDLLHELHQRQVPVYAITNFSREKFAQTREKYDFFEVFRGIVVSAEVRLIKPDPAIYLRLCQDHALAPADCVFIDDSPVNVAGARAVGMQALHFTSAARLRDDMSVLGLL